MSRVHRWLSLLVCVLSPLSLAADELPPRAVARLGDYRFYHRDGLWRVAINQDGRRVATAGEAVILWDAMTGEAVRRWNVEEGDITCLAFSPDGKQLAVGGKGNEKTPGFVHFYDSDTGKLSRRLEKLEGGVIGIRFTPDGRRLHISEAETVSSWDTATGKRSNRWKAPKIPLRETDQNTTYDVKEGLLSADEKVVLWYAVERRNDLLVAKSILHGCAATTGKQLYELRGSWNQPVQFSADGKWMILGGDRHIIRDVASGKVVREVKELLSGLEIAVLLPDGRRALVSGEDDCLRVYDLETGKLVDEEGIIRIAVRYSDFEVSGDGRTLCLNTSNTVRLWNLRTGKERTHSPGHRRPPHALWFAQDGRTLVSRCPDYICEWGVATAKEPIHRAPWHSDGEESIRGWSPDGRFCLTQLDGQVRLRETRTGKLVRSLEGQQKTISRAVFSPTGDRVTLVSPRREDKGIAWYDVTTGKRLGRVDKANQFEATPVFSADGRFLAWLTADYTIAVVDVARGKLLPQLGEAEEDGPNYNRLGELLAFSPDGEYLAASPFALRDGPGGSRPPRPLRVYRVRDGLEIFHFVSPTANADDWPGSLCLAFSPDGRLLAVAEETTKKVRLLEVATGQTRAEFAGHREMPMSLAFSADGKTLASGGFDNVIYLWDVTGARMKRNGKERGSPTELDAGWKELCSADAVRAGEALSALIRTSEHSVTFLKERLHPIAVDEKRLARLIADLDADAFEKREAASRELAEVGGGAESVLRLALKNHPSPEVKRRVEELLEKLDRHTLSSEELQSVRAVEVLEHIGTPEARRLLEALAKGAPEARLTRDAKASLKRLEKQEQR